MTGASKKRMLFFYINSFTQRDWDRFGLEHFVRAGFSIEIVQLHRMPGFEFLNEQVGERAFRELCIYPESADELDRHLSTLNAGDVAFVTTGFERRTAWLYRLLTKHRVKYIVSNINTRSNFKYWRSALTLQDLIRNKTFDIVGVFSRLLHVISLCLSPNVRYLALRSPSVCLQSGEGRIPFVPTFPNLRRAKIVPVENAACREIEGLPEGGEISSPYAVFLDQNLPFHPDFLASGSPTVDAETYEKKLKASFSYIEEKLGMPVVIALGPRKGKSQVNFGDRKVVAGQSAKLVRDASLVICHYSNAGAYAVLLRKPLLFLTSDNMADCGLDRHVAAFSSWLGLKRVRMEDLGGVPDFRRLLKFNVRCYEAYERTFLRVPGASRDPLGLIAAGEALKLGST